MTEHNQSSPPKYHVDEYNVEQLDALIREEEEKWKQLGISLDNLQFGGGELFFMQCKIQAITNCIIEGQLDEERLNRYLKSIIAETMEGIREGIEPQVREARIQQLRQGLVPRVVMPWEKPNGGR